MKKLRVGYLGVAEVKTKFSQVCNAISKKHQNLHQKHCGTN